MLSPRRSSFAPLGAPPASAAMNRSEPASRIRKKSTIYDLARLAEVSPGTVSRVLNNRDKVKPETRERVLQAARALFAEKGWLGAPPSALGIKVAFTPIGIFIAMVFIGIPFVVRTVQPVLQELDPAQEEAAASLGAGRGHTFLRVVLPNILPALLTGFALAFARGVGEYGSVIFIAGNMPMHSEIVPLLIVTQLQQFDYGSATAIALAMLAVSFTLLLLINLLQAWARRNTGKEERQ